MSLRQTDDENLMISVDGMVKTKQNPYEKKKKNYEDWMSIKTGYFKEGTYVTSPLKGKKSSCVSMILFHTVCGMRTYRC